MPRSGGTGSPLPAVQEWAKSWPSLIGWGSTPPRRQPRRMDSWLSRVEGIGEAEKVEDGARVGWVAGQGVGVAVWVAADGGAAASGAVSAGDEDAAVGGASAAEEGAAGAGGGAL